MKKLFLFAALFAAGFAVTSCSSDKDVVADDANAKANGGDFIAVNINLPIDPASTTRTGESPDNAGQAALDNGVDVEYAVKNATVIIFDGSENFLEAHDITPNFNGSSSDDHITSYMSTTNIIQTVSKKVFAGCKLLVILNDHGLIDVTGSYGLQVAEDGVLTDFTGTYSALQAKINVATTTGLDASAMVGTIADNGLFMANAPLADVQGSTTTEPTAAKVQVLVPITATYKTADLATSAANPDKIYVERGMAKVTVASGAGSLSNAKKDGSVVLDWSTTAWTLDNCNPTSYLIRSTDGFDGFKLLKSSAPSAVYRTIGNSAISEGTPTFKYRTYFSKGTQYAAATPALNTVSGSSDFKAAFYTGAANTFALQAPQYCFENTFPVAYQSEDHTTMIQLKTTTVVHGESAANLYTIGTDKSTVYDEDAIKNKFKAAAAAYVETNKTTLVASGTTIESADFGVTSISRDETTGLVNGVVMTYTASTGDAVLDGSAFKSGSTLSDAICSAVYSAVNTANGNITQYVGGVSYYHIKIKHFGDNLTPWNSTEYGSNTAPSGNTVATIYPDNVSNRDGDYLGRYGVLRNNWYHLSVNSIRFLGDAVPHTGTWTDIPDDEVDEYIAFKIYVLSWAKRTQSADL